MWTRRTLTRTRAPILSSFCRMAAQVAAANPVWARPMRRSAQSSTQAAEANHGRIWLARILAAKGRSAKRPGWHSSMRFPAPPRVH